MAVTRANKSWLLLVLLLLCLPLLAAVLPEDRADALYHRYSGGGVTIDGPSLQVRKQIGDASVSGHYYVDAITSASIDVVTQATSYNEERTEYGVNVDYLTGKTIMSLGYTTSGENDYNADTVHFSISQGMIGDLTTLSMGYSHGSDSVGMSTDPDFDEEVSRHTFKLGLSQVVSKNLLLDLAYDFVTDQGYLNNPYRTYRYLDTTTDKGYGINTEKYPETRNSNAMAIRGLYYLPYRAALKGEYRIFNDSWGITSSNASLGYTHPAGNNWIFEFSLRRYQQTQANFYSDLFLYQDAQNYMARDKELSQFNNKSFGLGVSYQFAQQSWGFIDKGSINFAWDHIIFDYENFRDLRVHDDPNTTVTPGEEPLYGFSANVIQFYISIWY